MIITIESADGEQRCAGSMKSAACRRLSVAMVYHQTESEPEVELSAELVPRPVPSIQEIRNEIDATVEFIRATPSRLPPAPACRFLRFRAVAPQSE